MVASGTAARNALTDGANQSRTVLTGCQKSAGTNAVTGLMYAGCVMQVGKCLLFGSVRSQILINWTGFGVRFWIESTDCAEPFPDACHRPRECRLADAVEFECEPYWRLSGLMNLDVCKISRGQSFYGSSIAD